MLLTLFVVAALFVLRLFLSNSEELFSMIPMDEDNALFVKSEFQNLKQKIKDYGYTIISIGDSNYEDHKVRIDELESGFFAQTGFDKRILTDERNKVIYVLEEGPVNSFEYHGLLLVSTITILKTKVKEVLDSVFRKKDLNDIITFLAAFGVLSAIAGRLANNPSYSRFGSFLFTIPSTTILVITLAVFGKTLVSGLFKEEKHSFKYNVAFMIPIIIAGLNVLIRKAIFSLLTSGSLIMIMLTMSVVVIFMNKGGAISNKLKLGYFPSEEK